LRAPALELGPRELPFKEGISTPLGYHLEDRARTSWIENGLGVAASCYLAGGLVASMIDASGPQYTSHRWLYLPVAGPFVTAANHLAGVPSAFGDNATFDFVLIIDGLLQAGGVAAAAYGVFRPEQFFARDDLTIAPYSNGTSSGLVLRGTL
jgi:hypothetical protein